MPEVFEQIHATAGLLVPEIILVATVCALFVVGPLLSTDSGDAARGMRHQCGFLSLLALVVAWWFWHRGAPGVAQGSLFRLDELVWFTRGLTLSVGIVLTLVLWNQIDDGHAAEAHACQLAILAGTNLVAAASDLVSLFLALELVSIPTYVILYLPRRDRIASESALKYFLLSVFSSALVLYGMSWLYGVIGSTSYSAISQALESRPPHAGEMMLEIAFALLVAGLSFRIAAVPFHFYAPDVFQGTTASNAALLSFVPKVVGFVALLRLIPLTGATENWSQWAADYRWMPDHSATMLFALLAAATMFVGNLMAVRQKHLYRLMAYSSIAHAGYMLVGLAVGDVRPVEGTRALLFYLAAYGPATIGVFALLGGSGEQGTGRVEHGAYRSITTLDDLRGLSRVRPAAAFLLAICLFSLTGLPPTVGFLAKLNLFLSAWSDGTRVGMALAILVGANAAIAAWYYLRMIALTFLDPATEPTGEPVPISWPSWLAGASCALFAIATFVDPQWLWDSVP